MSKIEDLKNKKIVVTGGAGFIGSHIVEELINLGCKNIIVIDDLSTGNIKNIKPFLSKINFINGSIINKNLLKKTFKGIDYVLHQAAIPSVPRSIEDPHKTNDVNIGGTMNVFWAAKENNVKRVIYACSSSTYGNVKKMPVKEDYPLNPMSPYAVQKAADELYGKVFNNLYGLETVGLKYFNVFGPRQDPNSKYSAVIPTFIKSISNSKSPTINGDGSTTRDFTYVRNVVKANFLACVSPSIGGQVFNVSCGQPVSLNDLVNKINRNLKLKIKPIYVDFRAGDIPHSYADISKAKKFLGYKPEVDFDKGLALTIKHFLN